MEEDARKVRGIIGVIEGIAFQTNILALNAAVEAARAGGLILLCGIYRAAAGATPGAQRPSAARLPARITRPPPALS